MDIKYFIDLVIINALVRVHTDFMDILRSVFHRLKDTFLFHKLFFVLFLFNHVYGVGLFTL